MVDTQLVANELDQEQEFDFESLVLRRADPDDFEEIVNLVEVGEDDIYGRVYSYPNVLKLIETAYLAITVIDRDGNVVGFAAFEDYPSVSDFAPVLNSSFRRLHEGQQTTSISTSGRTGSRRRTN